MDAWYRVTTPRAEVREGRSFNPDEFAIALEQVVAKTAPEDYRDPKKFFERTCFTRALSEHLGLVLRRLAGETQNAPADLTLITQFGGGKTHTLTALYHTLNSPQVAAAQPEIQLILKDSGLPKIPQARVAVFVGNAWDPSAGKETPWIDIARQLAGAQGAEILGGKARTSAPGTESLDKLFKAAGGCVLLLFDEVLNFMNRHRDLADGFYAFLDNTVRAMTASRGCAAILSLPRSAIEMTDADQQWLDRTSKAVHRVAKDLIANDESEIGEVVRRRLFEDLGQERTRKTVSRAYADWCFERKHQLPPEWTSVDTVTTDAKAREYLRTRFEAAYPFHPATISVFQRKWQGLPHYQRTRGTLAVFAQWISWAGREAFRYARKEPLITLGSAPLHVPEFQAAILGQLGEQRLLPAIEVDIAGAASHAKALDADTKAELRDIHRRVGAAILFESTGVASDKAAHLPELRFALGEPDLDVTSIDNAATALEKRAFFVRKVGTDGFRIGYKPTLKKVVGDRKAALDDTEVTKTMRSVVKEVAEKGKTIPVLPNITDGADASDSPRLALIVIDPEIEWDSSGELRTRIAEWTRVKGGSPRFYPAALAWLVRRPGRALREKAELLLAWKRVAEEMASGVLGAEFDASDHSEISVRTKEADEALRDEVWASYRHLVVLDSLGAGGVREIDLGAGHSSASASLTSHVISALRAEGLLNESVGAGYIERNWPPALKESGAWPLKGLRQAFLDGTLTRLIEPEEVLRRQIVAFVDKSEFGIGSGPKDGGYQRVWWKEGIGAEEILFDDKTFLLTRQKAAALKEAPAAPLSEPEREGEQPELVLKPSELIEQGPSSETVRLSLRGTIPPEQWNRLGTKLLPKLRGMGSELSLGLDASLLVRAEDIRAAEAEVRQVLRDLGLDGLVQIERGA